MDGKDLADYIVSYGSDKGATYVEARFIEETASNLTLINGHLFSGGETTTSGIALRVLVDGGLGFSSFNTLTKDEAQKAVELAIRLARGAKRAKNPIVFSEEEVHQAKWQVDVEIPISSVSSDEKLSKIQEIDKAIQESAIESKIPNRNVMFGSSEGSKYFVNSEGARIEAKLSHIRLFAMLTFNFEGKIEQRFAPLGGAWGWEWFDKENVLEAITEDVKAHAIANARAKENKFEVTDMIVGPEVAGIIAHENAGHPFEADRIWGREGAEAGESYVKRLKIGESIIGSEHVTVIDDPTIPHSGGFYLYDDEGVKARPRYLIKNGLVNELLHNRETAAIFGTQSTAAARATGYRREPIIRMANTYIAPGDFSFDELVEDVKEGIFMETFSEWNIDDQRYQSKYVGSLARVIRNGEITDEYVRRPTLELTTEGLFKSVDGVAKGFKAWLASCGKGNPMQGIPVFTAGPEGTRMRNIRLSK